MKMKAGDFASLKGKIYILISLLVTVLFTGFIIPAYKMAELMEAQKGMSVLVLNGNTFLNLGKDYLNTPVPCRVIIKSSGYIKQDYLFPKASVSIIDTDSKQDIILNNVRMISSLPLFSKEKVFTVLMGLYLSENPLAIFKKAGINQSEIAYGLANNRAAYIIGSDNNQLFIDNEDRVPLMYRTISNHVYQLAVVKSYLNNAELANENARLINGPHLGVSVNSYKPLNIILPRVVELYKGDMLIQRWEFSSALILPRGMNIDSLLLSQYDIKRLSTTNQALSPFMLF